MGKVVEVVVLHCCCGCTCCTCVSSVASYSCLLAFACTFVRSGYYISTAIMTEITDEQLEELKDAFVLYDNVGDDKIDSGDVIKLLQSLALNPLTADVKKVLEDSQLDKTRVDFPTFVSIYEQFQKRPTIANHADLIEMFKCFDREGNKMVFGGEFRQVMNNLGDAMNEKDIEFFIGPLENADGYVAYEDLIKHVMSG